MFDVDDLRPRDAIEANDQPAVMGHVGASTRGQALKKPVRRSSVSTRQTGSASSSAGGLTTPHDPPDDAEDERGHSEPVALFAGGL
jgi:hypothetical protein